MSQEKVTAKDRRVMRKLRLGPLVPVDEERKGGEVTLL